MDFKQEVAKKEAELQNLANEYNAVSERRNQLTNDILKVQGTIEYLRGMIEADSKKNPEKK